MLKVITAAALLSWAPIAQISANLNVQSSSIYAPVVAEMQIQAGLNASHETILIENHAAPHWNLTIEEAWYQYDQGQLVIVEIEKDRYYELQYNGDYLSVLIEDR